MSSHTPIAIIGTGFAGLGMGIRLKQAGIEDFLLFERAGEVGGTWRDNSYPGCACDVESYLYSFSFAPNPNWSRIWSPQPEIFEYLKRCTERFGLRPHLRFHRRMESAAWDEINRRWNLKFSNGEMTADILISATGALSEPNTPSLPGLDRFRGKLFHSAQWDHSDDLRGRNVAVIGTGASAAQFVPEIQPLVKKLSLFQRTPPWVIPYRNDAIPPERKRFFAKFPFFQKLIRLRLYLFREFIGLGFRHPRFMNWMEKKARSYLAYKIKDPELRKKLTPTYRIGCKRVLISRTYLPALTKENIEVITDSLVTIGEDFIETKTGKISPLDTIILGTGFKPSEMHLANALRGRGGKTLSEAWQGSPKAYLGTSVSGFPNLFLLFGPNTGLGHTSVIIMAEGQIAHVLGAIKHLKKNNLKTAEPKAEKQERFVRKVDVMMQGTVWASGCSSWYLDASGRNSTLWPFSVGSFRRRVRRFHAGDYVMEGAR